MADIQTIWSPPDCRGDWAVSAAAVAALQPGAAQGIPDAVTGHFGLVSGHDLQTAVLISLFTDAEASTDDLAATAFDDPRGWWGDDAKALGSKLWLRLRSKQTDITLALVKGDIAAALQWLIDDGVAASVDVEVEWSAPGMLGARVTLSRGDGQTATLAFDWAWKGP
ncbi:MAG: phage GP46 family protein [Sphingomonadaceae bacterium]|nr:phage GP46 family protein [Sphingomonadaceae bacterium]